MLGRFIWNISFNRLRFFKILGFGYADSAQKLKFLSCIASQSYRCLNTDMHLRDISNQLIISKN